MKYHSLILLVVFFILGHSQAIALGVGEPELHSRLGEPLLAKLALTHIGDLSNEQIHIRKASADMYKKLGSDYNTYIPDLSFELTEQQQILIRSGTAIKEPYIDIVLHIRWPQGETYKKVTLLLDPVL